MRTYFEEFIHGLILHFAIKESDLTLGVENQKRRELLDSKLFNYDQKLMIY